MSESEYRRKVEMWTDEKYEYLDAGIRPLVKSLHQSDIDTYWSCEGHIREYFWETGIYPYPWVVVFDTQQRVQALSSAIDEWNSKHEKEEWTLSTERIHGSLTPDYVQTYILPRKRNSTMKALTPLDRNEELSLDKLRIMQSQIIPISVFIEGNLKIL